MNVNQFIDNFRKAFGKAELPVAFWYSDEKIAVPERTPGCFIKALRKARDGQPMSFDAESILCGGGKLYTGFSDMAPRIPGFVSNTERYRITPELVEEGIRKLDIKRRTEKYIHFVRVDKLDSFDAIEGLIFFATPDVLSGLVGWAHYDTIELESVCAHFGSGCSTIISEVVAENRKQGKRTFLGLFDPSVRPSVAANILSFAIPLSRFKEMYETMTRCFLYDSKAWDRVRNRINEL